MAKVPKKPKERHDELTADERELFLSAFFQGEIGSRDKYGKGDAKSVIKTVASLEGKLDDQERAMFLQAVEDGLVGRSAHHKQEHRSKTKSALAKKKHLVDAQIDLHGLSAENAVFLLNSFIDKE